MKHWRTQKRKMNDWKFNGVPHPLLTASMMIYAATNIAKADDTVPTAMSPPAHTALRYDEDYSYLKDPASRTNLFDSLKYIPLNKQGDSYLTFGGQEGDRDEYFNNKLFGNGPQSPDGYNL